MTLDSGLLFLGHLVQCTVYVAYACVMRSATDLDVRNITISAF